MSSCEDTAPYALVVQGDSMVPEFPDGTVVIVDPAYPAAEGAFVVAEYHGDLALRQLTQQDGQRCLKALNPAYPAVVTDNTLFIHGVVVQQNYRRKIKHYT